MSPCFALALRTVLAAAAAVLATTAFAENRLAFVVGIDNYGNLSKEMQLARAVADAETVGDTLAGLSFKVTRLTSGVTQETLLKRFDDFRNAIAPGDTVAFFFAGHGIGLENANYLIPADIPLLTPENELLVRSRAIAETDLIALIQERKAGVTMMVIDACRNNPFPTRTGVRGTETLGLSRGLAVKEPPQGVLSIYSAGFGQLALDRLSASDPSSNSVFTRVFVAQLKKPGINIVELGEAVRDDVATLADSVRHQQVPAVYNQIRGARSIFLAGPPPTEQQPAAPAADEVAWVFVKETKDAAQLRVFVAQFPSSTHRVEAEARIAALEREAADARAKLENDRPKVAIRESPADSDLGTGNKPLAVVQPPRGSEVLKDPGLLKEIRSRLYELNFDPGSIDAQQDNLMKRAIREFESQNKMAQTGQATLDLLHRLRETEPATPWGAIVYAEGHNKWGMSWGEETRERAVAAARKSCGDPVTQCSIEVSFFGKGCASFAHSDKAWAIEARANVQQAKDAARANCRRGRTGCQIIAAVCADGSEKQGVLH